MEESDPKAEDIEERRLGLEFRKLEIDKQRLELERQRLDVDNRVLNRHLGVIVTSIVSLVALALSATQLYIAYANRKSDVEIAEDNRKIDLKIADANRKADIEAAKLAQQRQWGIQLADFVFGNKDIIFGGATAERETMRNVLLVTYPSEVTAPLFQRLEATAPEKERAVWQKGAAIAQKITPQIIGNLAFSLIACSRESEGVRCSLSATNTGDSEQTFCIASASRILDGQGGEHRLGGQEDCAFNINVAGQSQARFTLEFQGARGAGENIPLVEVGVDKSSARWHNVPAEGPLLAELSLGRGMSATVPETSLVLTLTGIVAAEPNRLQAQFSMISPGRGEEIVKAADPGASFTYGGYEIRLLSLDADSAKFSVGREP
ncbi:MAG TPA: hypothetical protein VMW27_12245 [Thermoanaerobaculia bacterium]|nr:hypothetical protein [Thermoanaerobaculia bacterium]